MLKLYKDTKDECVVIANACHSLLIGINPSYADSFSMNQTVKWSEVYQEGEYDANFSFIPSVPEKWYLWVDEKVKPALSQQDQDLLWPVQNENI